MSGPRESASEHPGVPVQATWSQGDTALPVGTLTFLMTDVEGSTRLWERFPEAMRFALARHDALIQGHVEAHNGTLVRPRGEGDSRFAVFQRASDAVAAACGIQIALVRERWPLPEPLRVRMALHTGETELREGDYYGTAVNRCARLRGLAHGGQTLLSSITAELVHDQLPVAASLRKLGTYQLRGLEEPEHVFQLDHPVLLADTHLVDATPVGPRRTHALRMATLKWLRPVVPLLLAGAVVAALVTRIPLPASPTEAPTDTVAPDASGGSTSVLLANLEGEIDPVTAEYVHRAVGMAEDQQADLIVLILNTPGGLDTSMHEIVQDLLNTPVPSVVYVGPAGARAASAGLFVAAGANLIGMAPGTTIGVSGPRLNLVGETPPGAGDTSLRDALAYVSTLAQQRGRAQEPLERLVSERSALSAQDAIDEKLADVLAPDVAGLLRALDGRTINTTRGPITLHTGTANIASVDMGVAERIAERLFDPNIAYVLLAIGLFAIVVELFHPGAILPGLTGAVCVILAFAGFSALPMNWAGLLLIVAAISLLMADMHLSARGGLSVGALICFVFGSVLLYSPFGPRSVTLPDASVAWPLVIGVTGMGACLSLWIVSTALRIHNQAPITGPERLIGARGLSHTPLDPEGTVQVRGQLWSARLVDGRLDSGVPVRVLTRKGLTLEVEAAPDGVGPLQEPTT